MAGVFGPSLRFRTSRHGPDRLHPPGHRPAARVPGGVRAAAAWPCELDQAPVAVRRGPPCLRGASARAARLARRGTWSAIRRPCRPKPTMLPRQHQTGGLYHPAGPASGVGLSLDDGPRPPCAQAEGGSWRPSKPAGRPPGGTPDSSDGGGAPRAPCAAGGARDAPPQWLPFPASARAPLQAASHASPMRRNSASRAAPTALAASRSVSAMAIASSCPKVTPGRSHPSASGSDLSRS